MVKGDFVFGFYPCSHFGSSVVFHPRIRVVDFGAEIGVDGGGFASFGVRNSLFFVSAT